MDNDDITLCGYYIMIAKWWPLGSKLPHAEFNPPPPLHHLVRVKANTFPMMDSLLEMKVFKWCLLIQSYFCAVCDNVGKAGLSKGYWNPKTKLGVTTHFQEIHGTCTCTCN